MKQPAIIFVGFRHKTSTVEIAKEEGYKAILLLTKKRDIPEDLFDEIKILDLSDTDEIDATVKVLKKVYKVKGIVSNYEHFVVPRAYLAEKFGLPSNSVYSACTTRNKAMQRHALAFTFENIDYRIVHNLEEVEQAFEELGQDIYLKSIAGIKSKFIFHIANKEDLKHKFKVLKEEAKNIDEDLYNDFSFLDFKFKYLDPKTTFLVEKAESGKQITVSAIAGSHKIWHTPSVCDIYTASDLGVDDSYLAIRVIPSKLSDEIQEKAMQATETASKVLGLRYCSIFCELILTEDNKIKLIEIASRTGGYRHLMYKEAFGVDIEKQLLKAVMGKAVKIKTQTKKYTAILEVFSPKEGELSSIQNLNLLDEDADAKLIKSKQLGDKAGPAKLGYQPCALIKVTGENYEQVLDKAKHYHSKIKADVI